MIFSPSVVSVDGQDALADHYRRYGGLYQCSAGVIQNRYLFAVAEANEGGKKEHGNYV